VTEHPDITTFRRIFDEVLGGGQLDVLDEIVGPGFVEHQFAPEGSPGRPMDPEGLRRFVIGLRSSIPDLHYTIEDTAYADGTVWMRVRARGTDSGTGQFGFPPTGKPISIDVIDVARFDNGRMVEHWGVPDRMSILIQLGHISGRPREAAVG
jgi:predicted ester cyclase